MRLPGRKKAADQDITAPGPAPAPLAPSIAANVLPGVALPGWAVYTLQANAAGGPQAPAVGAGWGAADPDYGAGEEYSGAADPELEAGAYAVAQSTVLAAWEASWEWQQDAGPSPEDLLRQATDGAPGPVAAELAAAAQFEDDPMAAVFQATDVQEEVYDLAAPGDGEEDLAALLGPSDGGEPERASAALPESGLDIPVAEPEFLVDQPSVDEAQEFGLALDEDGFPIVEEGQPSSIVPAADPAASLPVDDDGALAVTDEPADTVPVADDDALPVADDSFDPLPVADGSDDSIPVAEDPYGAIPVADEQYYAMPSADDEGDSPFAADGHAADDASPGWGYSSAATHPEPEDDEGSLTVTDSDADVDMDAAAAASAPPPSGLLPDQQTPPPGVTGSAADYAEPAADTRPGYEPTVPPGDEPTPFSSIPAADEPSVDLQGEDQVPSLDREATEDPTEDSDLSVNDDLWQALALAAEEAGRGGAGAAEAADGEPAEGEEGGAADRGSDPPR